MAAFGIAFRATADYNGPYALTDTYSLGEAYPVTRIGLTFGWSPGNTTQVTDRLSANPKQLQGRAYALVGAPKDFLIDLPSGPGTYTIRLAIGDPDAGVFGNHVVLKDGTTPFATITGNSDQGQFLDASGVLRTSAALWVSNNVSIQRTFTTSTFRLTFAGGGTVASMISYIWIDAPAAPNLVGDLTLGAFGLSGSLTGGVASTLSGNVTLGDLALSGSLYSATAVLSGNLTLGNLGLSGSMAMQAGAITTPPLKNNTGTVLASVSGIVVNVYGPTTGQLVVRKTGQSTNASGVLAFSDALIVPGQTYVFEVDLSATAQGRILPSGVAA